MRPAQKEEAEMEERDLAGDGFKAQGIWSLIVVMEGRAVPVPKKKRGGVPTGRGDDGSSDDARQQKQATLAKDPGSVAAALGGGSRDKEM